MSQEKKRTVKQQVHEKHIRCPARCPKIQIDPCLECGGVGLVLESLDLNYQRELEVE